MLCYACIDTLFEILGILSRLLNKAMKGKIEEQQLGYPIHHGIFLPG